MLVDYSVARWAQTNKWPAQNRALSSVGTELPPILRECRPLGTVHRLDLALFVVFEEASLRVSGALVRRAPTVEALAFGAQQTADEARHHELFRARLEAAGNAAESMEAIVTPPLRRFLDHCFEVADNGPFVDALTLMNLVLEGMAYPLYAYERRYWAPVDPYLAELVHSAYADETRHVAFGAELVRTLLADDPAARARVARVCNEARRALAEVFEHYIRRFVGLFDAVARRHGRLFAGAELAPGRLIADTPYAEQVQMINQSITEAHDRLLERAGLAVNSHTGGGIMIHFLIAFAAIDVVGYLPGMIAQRLRPNRPIARIYYHLYNFTHDWWTLGAAVAIWMVVSGPEWAMLALPLHLAGDQGVLGNFKKPIDRPFEVRA